MLFPDVDVFVRQIDTAGDGGISVDDADFPVVPVSHAKIQKGTVTIKNLDLDAELPQIGIIFRRKRLNAAQIVV